MSTDSRIRELAAGVERALERRPAKKPIQASWVLQDAPWNTGQYLQPGETDAGKQISEATGIARYIDHTLLRPEATKRDVLRVCEEAIEHGFASVCLNPTWVRDAAAAARGTQVQVCTVVGFPLGANATDVKVLETRRAIFDGATELDMVIDIGGLMGGEYERVFVDVGRVVEAAKDSNCLTKAIIETALLGDEDKIRACLIAAYAGADFVKTSTGFSSGGATIEDVGLMRRVVGEGIGVKAAGGIRDYASAAAMIRAGATRIGTSAGMRIFTEEAALGQAT